MSDASASGDRGDRTEGGGGRGVDLPSQSDHVAAGRRARKKALTRSQILEAATRLFWQRGYEATTVQDIADEADVAFRTFYLHFATKADVAIARFEDWIDALVGAMADRPRDERPDAMLAGALDSLTAQGYAGDVTDAAGIPVSPVPIAVLLAESSPEVAGRLFQAMAKSHQRMTELFRERMGCPEGSFEPRIVAASLHATFIATVYGFAEASARGASHPSSNSLALRAMSAFVDGIGGTIDRARAS